MLNGGIPGSNTAQILSQLEANIAKAKPDLIILLAGGNDGWNYWGLGSSGRYGTSWQAGTAAAFDSIKLVRLAKLLRLALNTEPASSKDLYYQQAVLCIRQGNDARALELFKKIVALEPGRGDNYVQLAEIYSKRAELDEALAWLQKGIKADPGCLACYAAAGAILKKLGRGPESDKYLNAVFSESAPASMAGGSRYESVIRNWIFSDLARITAVCRERGVPLLIQNYPFARLSFFTPDIYYEAAKNNSLPLVDNYSVFLRETGKGRALLGSDPFGHPNPEGYGLMAADAAAAIAKAKMFPAVSR